MSENEDYKDFIVADNDVVEETTEDAATPQIETNTEEVKTETDGTIEPIAEVETPETKEKTETQRVSQRINEARQKGIDEHIAKQNYEWNGKPVTTEAQYDAAVAEQAEQERRASLEEKGIDVNMMDEAIANNPTVRQAKELIDNQNKQALVNKGYNDFNKEFPDVKPESISQETWQAVNEGATLVDAYTRQENKELKAKLKIQTQNETNKSKAPIKGGISTHGSDEVASEDDFMRGFNSI